MMATGKLDIEIKKNLHILDIILHFYASLFAVGYISMKMK